MNRVGLAVAWLLAASLMALGAEPGVDEPPTEPGQVRHKVQGATEKGDEGEEGPFTLELAAALKTAYVFRGYTVVDTGLIVQPEATLTFNGLGAVKPYVGVWNNFSEEKLGRERLWSDWNEFDATAGMVIERGDWSLDLQYNYYTSPSDAFDDVHEIGGLLKYAGKMGMPIALSPHVCAYYELKDDSDHDQNAYLEFGLEPEFELSDFLTLSAPFTLGTSLNHYYEDSRGGDEFFGYASAGALVTWKVNETVSLYGGVEYLRLLADSTQAANSGDEDKVVGSVGAGFSF
jgi:hypothetical protein